MHPYAWPVHADNGDGGQGHCSLLLEKAWFEDLSLLLITRNESSVIMIYLNILFGLVV